MPGGETRSDNAPCTKYNPTLPSSMVCRESVITTAMKIRADRTPSPAQAILLCSPPQSPPKGPSMVCLLLTLGDGVGPVGILPSSIILPPSAGDRLADPVNCF